MLGPFFSVIAEDSAHSTSEGSRLLPEWIFRAVAFFVAASLRCSSPALPAEAQALPEPWNSVSSLSSAQRQQVSSIVEKLAAIEDAKSRQITADLTASAKQNQTPGFTAITIASAIKQQHFLDQLIAKQEIYLLLSTGQRQEADNAWNAYLQTTEIVDFKIVAAIQQNDLFCWAAAFQALLNYNGIDKDQQWVADQVTGSVDPATVNSQELSTGIKFFYLDKHDPSNSISASAEYNAGLPGDDMLVNLILRNRMLVINLGGRHVGVLYKVSYDGSSWTRYHIKDVTYFDPLSGQSTLLKWQDATKEVNGWWYCLAERYLFFHAHS